MSHPSGGKSLWERLESIGKARDGLLLVTAGVHGLGYAIRAAHAP